jgi:hypothetical protein
MAIVSDIVWVVAWMCFEWPYANEHPLALEVDVGDGELVGERHDCGGDCMCVWSRKVRAVICVRNC